MVIAFIGDIVGRAGRRTVAGIMPALKKRGDIDLIVANLENAAGGFGITEKAFDELESTGIDFFTSGNHIWDKKEGVALLDSRNNIVRPANYPGDNEGVGFRIITVGQVTVGIFNSACGDLPWFPSDVIASSHHLRKSDCHRVRWGRTPSFRTRIIKESYDSPRPQRTLLQHRPLSQYRVAAAAPLHPRVRMPPGLNSPLTRTFLLAG